MKIYVCHSSSFDFTEELYKPLKESQLERDHEIFYPHDEVGKDINTMDVIKEADLIISEGSFASTGMGIELGRAEMLDKNIVFVVKKGIKPSTALRFLSDDFIEYEFGEDLVKQLNEFIENM